MAILGWSTLKMPEQYSVPPLESASRGTWVAAARVTDGAARLVNSFYRSVVPTAPHLNANPLQRREYLLPSPGHQRKFQLFIEGGRRTMARRNPGQSGFP